MWSMKEKYGHGGMENYDYAAMINTNAIMPICQFGVVQRRVDHKSLMLAYLLMHMQQKPDFILQVVEALHIYQIV